MSIKTRRAPDRQGPWVRSRRPFLYLLAIAFTLFMLLPLYLITLSAFSAQSSIYTFPRSLLPTDLSTDTLAFFLSTEGVLAGARNSVVVAGITLILSLVIGAPAGYALARYVFKGRSAFQLVILATRSFPIVILAIPLAVMFLDWNIFDTLQGVALAHTALALPTTVLITGSVFVSVPRDLEEAALSLGCTPLGAFRRVSLPLALPGIAAAALFTLVLSWNEVFAATILTVSNRTLPAQVLTTLDSSPLPYRFAGGFALAVPSLLFVFVIRRYLFNLWGQLKP